LQIENEILRPQKGVRITFFPELVVKSYNVPPTLISVEERDARFRRELEAYKQLAALDCPFVPKLVEYSEVEGWFSIQRIMGRDLFALSQTKQGFPVSVKSLLTQIHELNVWLADHSFWDLGTNLKDLLLDPGCKIVIVDFEQYRQSAIQGHTLEDCLIIDVLERLFIRKGRTARLTPAFLAIAGLILTKSPTRTWRHFVYVIGGGLKNTFRTKREALKQFIKNRTF